MGRGAVAITVEGDSGQSARLIATHLKSKLLTFPGNRFNPHDEDERARYAAYAVYRRAAEAATLRVAVSAALAGHGDERPLILPGTSTTPCVQAATSQLLLGPPGSEIGTRGFDQPDHGDPMRLWDLAPIMPAGRDYSRINQGRKELIDHAQPLGGRPPLDDQHRGSLVEVGVHDLGDVGVEAVAVGSFGDWSGSYRPTGDLRLARPLRLGAFDRVDRGTVQGEP
jgi:hypothetical protein